MAAATPTPKLVRFGLFELNLQRAELRKQGVKVKLQEQPLKILQLLLENPGQIVSREQLRAHIWPANTFVEFDQGLYSATARLRDALGDSSESPRFIETVARRGYRFIAPVTPAVPALPVPEKVSETRVAIAHSTGRRLLLSFLAGLLGGATLLVLLLTFNIVGAREWLYLRIHPVHSLAVLPLENLSGDAEQEYFADGMTDELITNLAKLGNFRVVSRTSVMRYKKVSKPVAQIGRDLNVDAVVEGTVERVGTHVRIRVQLIQTETDRHLWAQTYDRELRDALLLQSEAARDIVLQIRSNLGPSSRQLSPHEINPQAYEAYLKGLYFSNKRSARDFPRAIDYFQQAIAVEPHYAAAYSGLSNALLGEVFTGTPASNVRQQATASARKSIELDPFSPEAHDTLGGVYEFFDWDWPAAESEYRRALELNANFAAAHQDYAIFLSLQGRAEPAMAEALRSQELDPLSPFIRTTFCWDLYFARRYDQAVQKCRDALDLDLNFLNAHRNLIRVYTALHKPELAFQEYQKTAALTGRNPAQRAELQRSFQSEGVQGLWRTRLRWSLTEDSDPYEVASLHALLGQTDQAFAWLQKAYDLRSVHMEELKQDSTFDLVRSDPRFSDLLRRLKL